MPDDPFRGHLPEGQAEIGLDFAYHRRRWYRRGQSVSSAYARPYGFTGRIAEVAVEVK